MDVAAHVLGESESDTQRHSGSTLCYIDMLGMKARWRISTNAATDAYEAFHGWVRAAVMKENERHTGNTAHVRTDGAAIISPTPASAVRIGRDIFWRAYSSIPRELNQAPLDRTWLRGIIIPAGVRSARELSTKGSTQPVSSTSLHGDLLDAIHLEQAGVVGARLLVSPDLDLGTSLKTRTPTGCPTIFWVQATQFAKYPVGLSGFKDVLWMLPNELSSLDAWTRRTIRMSTILRVVNRDGDPAELGHVAPVQILFSEVSAMLRTPGNH